MRAACETPGAFGLAQSSILLVNTHSPWIAPARRNAEIMVVQEVMRWRREVERFSPERLDEFDAGIQHALEHPAALPRPEGR